jgi:hypothetical protein
MQNRDSVADWAGYVLVAYFGGRSIADADRRSGVDRRCRAL